MNAQRCFHIVLFICITSASKFSIFTHHILLESVFGSMASVSDDPWEGYNTSNAERSTQLQNSHPDAAATWLLLVLRGIDSGLSFSKDSAIKIIGKYLSHYVKVLSHVHIECRLSKDEEIRLLSLCSCCEDRISFLQQDFTWKALELGSAVTLPSFPLKITSAKTVLKHIESVRPKQRSRYDDDADEQTLW
jgi:hypothetical protein